MGGGRRQRGVPSIWGEMGMRGGGRMHREGPASLNEGEREGQGHHDWVEKERDTMTGASYNCPGIWSQQ